MKKTIFVLIPLCFFLAACAADRQPPLAMEKCPSGPAARSCPERPDGTPDPGQRNKIRLVVSAVGVDPQPPMVCAGANTTITVEVVGIPAEARVTTVPKEDKDSWILSSRTGNGDMLIEVPEGTPKGYYEYLAMTSTGKCVDPVIHIDRN